MPVIYVDADACPVKNEVLRVARRYGFPVKIVANVRMAAPDAPGAELVVVDDGFDAADDWIADRAMAHDIVVTDDIPLAARCLRKGAHALNARGHEFTEAGIGDAMATREILSHLRQQGMVGGGPAPFGPRDRSQFLQCLDRIAEAARRATK